MTRLWFSFCYPGQAPAEPLSNRAGFPTGTPPSWSGPMAALNILLSAAGLTLRNTDVQALEAVLHPVGAGRSLTPALFALVTLVQTGRQDEALRWSERLLDEPWILRVPMRRAILETIKSVAALRRGAPQIAAACAQTALDLVPPAAWGIAVGIPLSLAVRAATDLGDFPTAMSHLGVPVPAPMFNTPIALPYLQALGRYHLAMGSPETALTHFESRRDLMAKWRLDAPNIADWHHDAPLREPVQEIVAPELTDAERRVGALAAAGYTNREIAGKLSITISTVEQHLTKIYRKLKVRRRSALPTGLTRDL
jgi:DNA-binding CsgD family transcriptional regulator